MLSTLALTCALLTSPAAPRPAPLGDLDAGAEISVMRVIDGKLYVGGQFQRANRKLANNIAVWDGTSWSTLGRGVDGKVYDICGVGGKIYVVGDFSAANKGSEDEGIPARRIAAWDGTKWSGIAARPVDREIYALATDGKNLYLGGNFTKINDETETRGVAMYDGKTIKAIGGKFDRAVMSMVWMKGKLYAGGIFNEFGDDSFNKVAVWDGKTWSELGNGGLDQSVKRLATDGEAIYAAGAFTVDGSKGIAKFDGTKWSNVLKTSGETWWVHVENGKLYVAGDFTNAGGTNTHMLAIAEGGKVQGADEITYATHNVLMPFKGVVAVGGRYGDTQGTDIGGTIKWDGTSRQGFEKSLSGN